MKNIKVIGIHPATATNHILNMYDRADQEDKIKLLIQRHDANVPLQNELPARFLSKQTIDIRAGEMLSLGVIGLYYAITSTASSRTFQVVVGVEDALKNEIENLISDGAIWEDGIAAKMPFQHTLVQGYLPKKRNVTTDDVIKALNDKIFIRDQYPHNCGLLLSIYAETGQIDFKRIISSCDVDKYTVVYVLAYDMPGLESVTVTMLEKGITAENFQAAQRWMNLPRSTPGPWLLNDEDKV